MGNRVCGTDDICELPTQLCHVGKEDGAIAPGISSLLLPPAHHLADAHLPALHIVRSHQNESQHMEAKTPTVFQEDESNACSLESSLAVSPKPAQRSAQAIRSEIPFKRASGRFETDVHLGHRLRGLSVHYLATILQDEVRSLGFDRLARVHQLEEPLILAKGANQRCPRNGKLGAAYVDCVNGKENVGIAQFMLSHSCYTEKYGIGDISDTLSAFCFEKKCNPKQSDVWICCFCMNQHRKVEKSKAVNHDPVEKFKKDMSNRLTGIEHVIGMMEQPDLSTRAWCSFELCVQRTLSTKIVLHVTMPPDATRGTMSSLQGEGNDHLVKVLAALRNSGLSKDRSDKKALQVVTETDGPLGPQFSNDAQSARLQALIAESCYVGIERWRKNTGAVQTEHLPDGAQKTHLQILDTERDLEAEQRAEPVVVYVGAFTHSLFGVEPQSISVTVNTERGEGEWTIIGQTDSIAVSIDKNDIEMRSADGNTLLQGTYDAFGDIEAVINQSGHLGDKFKINKQAKDTDPQETGWVAAITPTTRVQQLESLAGNLNSSASASAETPTTRNAEDPPAVSERSNSSVTSATTSEDSVNGTPTRMPGELAIVNIPTMANGANADSLGIGLGAEEAASVPRDLQAELQAAQGSRAGYQEELDVLAALPEDVRLELEHQLNEHNAGALGVGAYGKQDSRTLGDVVDVNLDSGPQSTAPGNTVAGDPLSAMKVTTDEKRKRPQHDLIIAAPEAAEAAGKDPLETPSRSAEPQVQASPGLASESSEDLMAAALTAAEEASQHSEEASKDSPSQFSPEVATSVNEDSPAQDGRSTPTPVQPALESSTQVDVQYELMGLGERPSSSARDNAPKRRMGRNVIMAVARDPRSNNLQERFAEQKRSLGVLEHVMQAASLAGAVAHHVSKRVPSCPAVDYSCGQPKDCGKCEALRCNRFGDDADVIDFDMSDISSDESEPDLPDPGSRKNGRMHLQLRHHEPVDEDDVQI